MGKEELEATHVLSLVVSPARDVMAMSAVHVIVFVEVEPSWTDPNSTGEVQFSGKDTGDPRQMTLPLLSET